MLDVNVETWLEAWVAGNLHVAGRSDVKSAMQSQAKACARDAVAAGLQIAALKVAAGGDLEVYLLERQNLRSPDLKSLMLEN